MRNLIAYQENYQNIKFESIQYFFRKRKIVEILNQYNHNTILEIGCGFGSIFNDISSFNKIIVVEPAPDFYKIANNDRIKIGRENDIIIINKLIERCEAELSENKFDFIIFSSLLHEVNNPIEILKTIHSISSDETIIHINVPNAKSFHRLLALESGIIKTEFHVSENNIALEQSCTFDLSTLSELIENNGFEIIESGSYFVKPFTHAQMAKLIDQQIINNEMLEGFYNMEKYMPGLGSEIYVNVKIKKK